MSGPRIPKLLERLQTAFDGIPIVLAPLPVQGPPGPRSLRALADHLAALASESDGGVLVLGIDRQHPSRILGVADPEAWTDAIHRAAATLDPAPELEIEAGEELGRVIVAVRVDHGAVRRAAEDVRVSPMLAGVPGSNIGWLDPAAMSRFAPGWVATPSPEARGTLTRAGLLAADGQLVSRVGLLLAGRPEHRNRADGLALTTADGATHLRRGWLLLADDLRTHCKTEAADLVVDLVTSVLVRTAWSSAPAPLIVEVGPESLVIEASASLRDDPEIARRMARWAAWEREGWRATARRLGAEVCWTKRAGGLRVLATLPAPPSPEPSPIVTQDTPSRPSRSSRLEREAAVLALLADGVAWARRDIAARLGWSRSTLRNVLEGLVSDGRVLAEAESNRSPFQAYRIVPTRSPAHPPR